MARPQLRLPTNAPGPFYVDGSCIDCGTCWQWDPGHFASAGAHAHVHAQPDGQDALRKALLALQACPVAAIGTEPALLRQTPADGFPALITRRAEGEVMYCGWASRRSFGASSYLIIRNGQGGSGRANVLVDSPRFNGALARRLEALGGVDLLLLSHRDDVPDHQAFRDRFGCERWIHAGDADAVPAAEHRLESNEPHSLAHGWIDGGALCRPGAVQWRSPLVGAGPPGTGGLPSLLLVGLGTAETIGAAAAGPGRPLAASGARRPCRLRPRRLAIRGGRAAGAGQLNHPLGIGGLVTTSLVTDVG